LNFSSKGEEAGVEPARYGTAIDATAYSRLLPLHYGAFIKHAFGLLSTGQNQGLRSYWMNRILIPV
jgi:hypothetical protein